MLAAVIQKKYYKSPKYLYLADVIELRVDLIRDFDFVWASLFLKKINKPWILTIRKKSQGGEFVGSESERLALIDKCLSLKPDFVDLEYDVDLSFAKDLKKKHKNIKLIRSFHDFEKTPSDIKSFIDSLYNKLFDIHKFAFLANSTQDTLKMMLYLKTSKRPIALIAMGRYGRPLRVVGKILKNAVNYASVDFQKIANQLSLKQLFQVYNYQNLKHDTKVYALIGQDIGHSIGHLFHNLFFRKKNINAVYIKMELDDKELASFFSAAEDLSIVGVSVTTPFKSTVATHLSLPCSPVNTLKIDGRKWVGKNTDGIGACRVIASSLKKGLKALIIGSGPVALSIFRELRKNKIFIDVYNRNYLNACKQYPSSTKIIKDYSLVSFSDYDLVVNAASHKADFNQKIMLQTFKKTIMLFDVNYQAKKAGACNNAFIKFINGKDLFFSQAVYQQMFWNDQEFSFEIIDEFKKKWMKDQHLL